MSEKPSYEEQFDTTISRRSRRERRNNASKKSGGGVLEFLIILLVSFVLAFGFVRPFVEAFWIPSASMVPTLKYGDRVLVNKSSTASPSPSAVTSSSSSRASKATTRTS